MAAFTADLDRSHQAEYVSYFKSLKTPNIY